MNLQSKERTGKNSSIVIQKSWNSRWRKRSWEFSRRRKERDRKTFFLNRKSKMTLSEKNNFKTKKTRNKIGKREKYLHKIKMLLEAQSKTHLKLKLTIQLSLLISTLVMNSQVKSNLYNNKSPISLIRGQTNPNYLDRSLNQHNTSIGLLCHQRKWHLI